MLPFHGSSENSLLPYMVSVTRKVLPYMGAHQEVGVSEAFSKFCTPVFVKTGVQKSKNASETPNVLFYRQKTGGWRGPEGYKHPGNVQITPIPQLRERSLHYPRSESMCSFS